jgi:hypothetical protein
MKRITSTILTILLSSGLLVVSSGCTGWLDIRPEGEMVFDEYWQTELQAQSELAACYKALTSTDCTYRMLVWGELRSDDFTGGSSMTYDISSALQQVIEPTNNFANWSSFYTVINYCNTFIAFAPLAIANDENYTMDEYLSMKAEAVALRSLAYFYLVRAFKNVPYVTEPSLDDNQNYIIGQTSEQIILDSLVTDLQSVYPYAKSHYDSQRHTKGRITKNAISALLADIYLWEQQYDNCINECNKIIADKELQLVKAENMLTKVFYEGNSSESIFELQYDDN